MLPLNVTCSGPWLCQGLSGLAVVDCLVKLALRRAMMLSPTLDLTRCHVIRVTIAAFNNYYLLVSVDALVIRSIK